ncbi:AAA family ATPase [Rhizobium sp. LjRoot258]|uniref:AAA family ATPase n=1 Tax=Rhizobium sp. LjRoot258 TaxID=3342299 RepID=UPI003F5020C9
MDPICPKTCDCAASPTFLWRTSSSKPSRCRGGAGSIIRISRALRDKRQPISRTIEAFLLQALETSESDYAAHKDAKAWTFFDRGLVDAAVGLQHLTGSDMTAVLNSYRYHRVVFLTPPWREIYEGDPERRHSFDDAVAEHGRLEATLPLFGYQVVVLPKIDVFKRADLVLSILA